MLALVRKSGDAITNGRDMILGQWKILTQFDCKRHVPLRSGLGFVAKSSGWGAIPSLVSGLRVVGHVVWVTEMMIRTKPSPLTIDEVIVKSKSNNKRMIEQAKSTGDLKLDNLAWKKTKDECDRGIAYMACRDGCCKSNTVYGVGGKLARISEPKICARRGGYSRLYRAVAHRFR